MESFEKCHIETAGLHQPLPEEYFSYLLANRISNEELLRRAEIKPVEILIILRKVEDNIVRMAMDSNALVV